MATNEILAFCETDTGTNLLTQVEYDADVQRTTGNQPGVARSKLVNKALRQASLVSAALGQYLADNQSEDITDDLTVSELAALIDTVVGANVNQFVQLQSLSSSVASNNLTITYNGGVLDFRNASLTNGTPISNVSVSSNSIVIPNGATLGLANNQTGRLIFLEYYNDGSPVAGVINLTGSAVLDETNLVSPTTISSGATSANVFYSASSVSSNSPYRVIGFVLSTQTIAGTYATAPSLVQGIGGQALASLSSLGYGQSLQDVTRTSGTTYYNTTGKPILGFAIIRANTSSSAACTISINGGSAITIGGAGQAPSGTNPGLCFYMIPPYASYVLTDSGAGFAGRSTSEYR